MSLGGSVQENYSIVYENTGASWSFDGGGHKVVIDKSGRYWVAYIRYAEHEGSSTTDVFVAYSDDGEIWTEERVTNTGDAQRNVAIAIDSNNNVHLAWDGEGWGAHSYMAQYAVRTSGGWQTPETIGSEESGSWEPCITIDSNDDVHAVYAYDTGRIEYCKRTSGGWQTPEQVSVHMIYDQWRPALYVDSLNNIHVIWYGLDSTWWDYYVYYRDRTSEGWQSEIELSERGWEGYPTIITDSNNNVHVAYAGWTGTEDYYWEILYRQRMGGTWQNIEQITDQGGRQYNPTLSIDSFNNLHLCWTGQYWGDNTNKYGLQYCIKTTDSWEDIEILVDDTKDHEDPFSVILNNIYALAWLSEDNNVYFTFKELLVLKSTCIPFLFKVPYWG